MSELDVLGEVEGARGGDIFVALAIGQLPGNRSNWAMTLWVTCMLVIATIIAHGMQKMMAKKTPYNAVAGEGAILTAPMTMEA